jgi:hypothetical protein
VGDGKTIKEFYMETKQEKNREINQISGIDDWITSRLMMEVDQKKEKIDQKPMVDSLNKEEPEIQVGKQDPLVNLTMIDSIMRDTEKIEAKNSTLKKSSIRDFVQDSKINEDLVIMFIKNKVKKLFTNWAREGQAREIGGQDFNVTREEVKKLITQILAKFKILKSSTKHLCNTSKYWDKVEKIVWDYTRKLKQSLAEGEFFKCEADAGQLNKAKNYEKKQELIQDYSIREKMFSEYQKCKNDLLNLQKIISKNKGEVFKDQMELGKAILAKQSTADTGGHDEVGMRGSQYRKSAASVSMHSPEVFTRRASDIGDK